MSGIEKWIELIFPLILGPILGNILCLLSMQDMFIPMPLPAWLPTRFVCQNRSWSTGF